MLGTHSFFLDEVHFTVVDAEEVVAALTLHRFTALNHEMMYFWVIGITCTHVPKVGILAVTANQSYAPPAALINGTNNNLIRCCILFNPHG